MFQAHNDLMFGKAKGVVCTDIALGHGASIFYGWEVCSVNKWVGRDCVAGVGYVTVMLLHLTVLHVQELYSQAGTSGKTRRKLEDEQQQATTSTRRNVYASKTVNATSQRKRQYIEFPHDTSATAAVHARLAAGCIQRLIQSQQLHSGAQRIASIMTAAAAAAAAEVVVGGGTAAP